MSKKQRLTFKGLSRFRQPGLFVTGFALVGVALLLATRAATPVNNVIEPEDGVKTNVVVSADATASGGSYITFNAAASCPAGQTGTPPNCVPVSGNSVTGGTDSTCTFQKADQPMHLAFCEGFNQDYNNDKAVNRSGGLYNQLWGISRNNTSVNLGQGQIAEYYSSHIEGCGAVQLVFPTKDAQVCNGRLQEAVYDGGSDDPVYGRAAQPTNGLTSLTIYPKQPFDFAGRTGTVVFDVSADSAGPHQAWPEFWITDKPVPTPGDARSAWNAFARNSFGFAISAACGLTNTGIDHVAYTSSYAPTVLAATDLNMPNGPCPIKRATSKTGPLNHFELRISPTSFEIWGSDPGSSTLILLASKTMTMPLTKGLIWLEDVHYNACKFGANNPEGGAATLEQCDHDFAWDNVGFDGPGTYRDLAFDVPDANIPQDANTVQLGYQVGTAPVSLQVPNVFRIQTPTTALVTFNWFPMDAATVPSFSVNGNPYHVTAWPFTDTATYAWRTIDVAIPVSETKDGANTIQFKNGSDTVVSNVDLILVAGSPVPTALQ